MDELTIEIEGSRLKKPIIWEDIWQKCPQADSSMQLAARVSDIP
ncbi:MAG: hypothetical protein QM484_15160 [Woeseiaceae bacterium]